MEDKKIYIFQNWKFGTNSLEEFNEWDTEGEIMKKLEEQEIYKHTDDGKDAFLYISLYKNKLEEFAINKRNREEHYLLKRLKALNNLTFNILG